MNINELRTIGGIVSNEPVKVAVAWKEHTFDVHVRRLAFGDVERLMAGPADGRNAAMLNACILLGEAKEPLPIADAERLDVSLAGKLITVINEVNGVSSPN